MEKNLLKEAEEIIDLLRGIHKEFRDCSIEYVNHCGFTLQQVMLIHEVDKHPKIHLNELSDKLKLSKSTVCGIVDRLESQEIVIRKRPQNNKRVVEISLTEKALKGKSVIQNARAKYLGEILEKASKEEVKEILESLRKLSKLVKKEEI